MPNLRKATLAFLVLVGLGLWTAQPAFAAEPTLTALTLTPGAASLTTDQTTTFTLTGTYSDASTKNVTELAAWNPNGAGFTGIPSQKGAFTAVAIGTWTVTASLEGISASATVTITHGLPVALNLMPTPETVTTDTITPLRLFAIDADGNGWDVTSEATWATSEPTGKVTVSGYAPAVPGSWTVTATLGSLQATRTFMVTPGVVQDFNITPTTPQTVKVGGVAQLQATAYDADGNLLDPVVTWSVTNPNIGTVDATGLFTAKSAGQTNVIALAGNTQSITPIIVQGEELDAESDPEIVAVAKPVATPRTPRVAAEEIEKQPEVSTQTPAPISTAATDSKGNNTLSHAWIITLLIAHGILLAGYFMWLMRQKKSWWWAPPAGLTGVMLAVYALAVAKNTYLWWPWTIIGISVVFISVYYQRFSPHEASPGNTSPPTTS
ncbi:MAG: Ig-like domain-containing protein [Patescibacteria group bacterium]